MLYSNFTATIPHCKDKPICDEEVLQVTWTMLHANEHEVCVMRAAKHCHAGILQYNLLINNINNKLDEQI